MYFRSRRNAFIAFISRINGKIGGQLGNKIQVRTYGTYKKGFSSKKNFRVGPSVCAVGSPGNLNILKFYFFTSNKKLRYTIKYKIQLRATFAKYMLP